MASRDSGCHAGCSEGPAGAGPRGRRPGRPRSARPRRRQGQRHPSVSGYFPGEKKTIARSKCKKSFPDCYEFAVSAVASLQRPQQQRSSWCRRSTFRVQPSRAAFLLRWLRDGVTDVLSGANVLTVTGTNLLSHAAIPPEMSFQNKYL